MYVLTSSVYVLTSRAYVLTSRVYVLTSRVYVHVNVSDVISIPQKTSLTLMVSQIPLKNFDQSTTETQVTSTADRLRISACPENTYKENERSCMPCPDNSFTNDTVGNGLEGCVCREGYAGPPGGPCTGACVRVGGCVGVRACMWVCVRVPGGVRRAPGRALHRCMRVCVCVGVRGFVRACVWDGNERVRGCACVRIRALKCVSGCVRSQSAVST